MGPWKTYSARANSRMAIVILYILADLLEGLRDGLTVFRADGQAIGKPINNDALCVLILHEMTNHLHNLRATS